MPAKSTISSNLRVISVRRMPRIAPFRKTFSRPVSSGWKPVPTSRRLPPRPVTSAWPRVGSVIRERIRSSVVLPAPFRPMLPRTSPSRTWKETSSSAQMRSRGVRPVRSVRRPCTRWSRSVSIAECICPIRYCFERPTTSMARLVIVPSDQVGEVALDTTEVPDPAQHHPERDAEADGVDVVVRKAAPQHGPAEAVDHPGHRVQRDQLLRPRLQRGDAVDDRRHEEPDLRQVRNDERHVPVADVQRREPEADAERGQERHAEERRDHDQVPVRRPPVVQEHADEYREREQEVDHRRDDGRERDDQPREEDLRDQVLVPDDARAARRETGGEVGPREHCGEDEEGVRHVVLRLHVQRLVEQQREDDHLAERHEDRPGSPERGLLVLDLHVAPDEEEHELVVGPELAQVVERERQPAPRALDPDRAVGSRGLDRGHRSGLRTTWLPSTSTSIVVFWKVSTACSGVITIGSFSLNDVFRTTGTPVSLPNSPIRRW